MSAAPAADIPLDDLLLEAFLRLPPEPCHLLAASLVCRRWRRLVRSHAFLRRFRTLHRSPPVLGFFQNKRLRSCRLNIYRRCTEFVPIVSSIGWTVPPDPKLTCWVLDCRHGRVLLDSNGDHGLFVWDPMTGEVHRLSMPTGARYWDVAAAVVCADEHDDHTDCHWGPFRVVFLDGSGGVDGAKRVSAYVYSSETSAWSHAAAMDIPSRVSSAASTLVGSTLYWKLLLQEVEEEDEDDEEGSNHILEFDLPRKRLALIELPDCVRETYKSDIQVMPAEDGGIGFAGMHKTCIHLWFRKIDRGWVMLRMIDMAKLTLSDGDALLRSSINSFAEGTDELFLRTVSCVFSINLRYMQLRKVADARASADYPYTSFYTRGRDIAGIDDKDDDQ